MKKAQDIYKDKNYIPELLKNLNNDQIKKHLEHELYTYAIRAIFYKRMFYILSFITITFPALITVVNVFSGSTFSVEKLIVTILSALSSIAAGILGIANVRENWISYRSNCELLKEEIFKYMISAKPYDAGTDPEKELQFVENVIKICKDEASSWKQNNSSSNT